MQKTDQLINAAYSQSPEQNERQTKFSDRKFRILSTDMFGRHGDSEEQDCDFKDYGDQDAPH